MSVTHLDIDSLASVAAVAQKHGIAAVPVTSAALEIVAAANAEALAAQYGDLVSPATREQIAEAAERLLAVDETGGGWPPLVYNCVSNDGRWFLPESVAEVVRRLEDQCRKIVDAEAERMARAERDAVAYDVVPRLESIGREGLQSALAAAGATRFLIAEFRVNESDGMTDYYGYRTVRTVVLGLSTLARDSFPQLRKAAAGFVPTAKYGPGRGRFFARVTLGADCRGGCGWMYAGDRSPWHRDSEAGPFATRSQAEAHAAAHPIESTTVDGEPVPFVWKIDEDSIEHRENYSMGGGNYLGESRYSGWTVRAVTWAPDKAEVHSLSVLGAKRVRA